jgi:hypothetical protein
MTSYEAVRQWYVLSFATTQEMGTEGTGAEGGMGGTGGTGGTGDLGNKGTVVRPLSSLENMLIGAIAGSFSAAVTTPLGERCSV